MKIFAILILWAMVLSTAAPAESLARQSEKPTPAVPAKPALAAGDGSAPVAPSDPLKEAAIRKMFDIMGMSKLMQESLNSMAGNMRPMLLASLPPGDYREKLADLFIEKFQGKIQVGQLVELAVPVYAKYYTTDEIAALTEFYKTPLGKKTVSVTPQTMSDMQLVARKMGEEAGRASMMEVLAEHPDLAKSLEDASGGPKN